MVKTEKHSDTSKVKEEDKPFGCSECHRRFTRKGDMYRHRRTHTGEKPYACPECGDDFSRKDDMVRHLRTHTGLKPFDCMYCDRKFSRRADMYKHMVTHAGMKMKQESCPTCGCCTSEHRNDHPHIKDLKKRGKPPKNKNVVVLHKCSLCLKAFSRKRDMTRHLRTHSLHDIVNLTGNGNTVITNKENESHHENVQVQQVLQNSNILQDQQTNHILPHDPCESMVSQQSAATIPECKVVLISNAVQIGLETSSTIQIVTTDEEAIQNALLGIKDDKPFHCPQCGDKFGRKSDMIRHLRIHSGLKPYTCNLCGRPFSRKEDMTRHVLTHSGVKPYSCSICSKSFSRKTDFELHNSHHAMDICAVQCQSTVVEISMEN